MILEFKDWTISTLAGPLGYQLDNDTRKLTLQGDLPAGWTWDVLVEAGDNSDIWLLTPTEDGASIALTDENLSIRGAYYLQVRGTRGSQVRHCNVVTAYVLRTLAGTADWPTLPTEFAQAEQNIKELNAHPPIPGENGYWLLWDLANSAYRESRLPVPVGPAGPANTLTIGTVETLAPGQPATAQITGEAPNQTLSLGIPQGQTGQTGATPALSMGQVETLAPGEPATAELTGTPEAPVLSLGIPQGQPGKDGVQLEDSAVTTTAAWSSKKIVDTLCPAFTVSGNPVVCNPVENYPLDVSLSFTPKQEGTGDPSPDNVRPITGYDSLSLTRCGKNLLPMSSLSVPVYNTPLQETEYPSIYKACSGLVPGSSLRVSALTTYEDGSTSNAVQILIQYEDGSSVTIRNDSQTGEVQSSAVVGVRIYTGNSSVSGARNVSKLCLVYTQESNPTYEPYQGETYDIALPETVYGGTVDCVTGEGEKTIVGIELTGEEAVVAHNTENAFRVNSVFSMNTGLTPANEIFCSHYLSSAITDYGFWHNTGTSFAIFRDVRFSTPEEFKAYLAAQYAAGTPVTIAYQLATPEPFEVSPQPVLALPGANTFYTDVDSLEVSGRRDLLSTLEDLQHTLTAVTNIISEGGLT